MGKNPVALHNYIPETCKNVPLTPQLQYQENMPMRLEMPFEIYHLR